MCEPVRASWLALSGFDAETGIELRELVRGSGRGGPEVDRSRSGNPPTDEDCRRADEFGSQTGE